MSNYAVGYTVGDGEPQENADGEEYVPEHAVPIVDGVAVSEQPAVVEDTDEDEDGEPEQCQALTGAGEQCKRNAAEDGLCGTHLKKGDVEKVTGADGAAAAPADAPAANVHTEAERTRIAQEARGEQVDGEEISRLEVAAREEEAGR